MIGQTVGNYVVRKKIGEGGMGAVYVAEHQRLGRRVAVKVLLPQMNASAEMVARFFNEAKAATEIRNQHIVDVLDFGELPGGASYIVMEWLEGQSLAQLLAEQGKLPPGRVAHIAEGIAKALEAAHAHGIVHRDLKPDNIFLIDRDGDADFVKVLDFGIAKLTGDAADVRTQTGAILGTPYYMSPEQCDGGRIDRRTDVYAVGVILYQMLTGRLPFTGSKLTELLVAHATQAPPPLRSIDPTIAPSIEGAVLQALEKDPERRFNSVAALARAVAGEAAAARNAPAPAPFVAPPQKTAAELFLRVGLRGRRPLVAIAAATAVAVVAVLFATLQRGDRPAAPPAAQTAPSRWQLTQTDCPAGSVPAIVETTAVGTGIVSRAAGFPDTTGTFERDGRFKVRNSLGSCTGRITDKTVTETCTNKFHMSCHATYSRID
jgi:hypothetical protein